MKPIRNSVKAIIRRGDSVLLIREKDSSGDYTIFPGGGQDKFETMESTLQRECHEEIAASVIVDDLVLVREYIGSNHEFADTEPDVHQVEFYFSCRLVPGAVPGNGSNIDDGQVSVDWVPIADFGRIRVYPRALGSEFFSPTKRYFGDIN